MMDSKTQRLPCLTIWQPWASRIMRGVKPIENRTWETKHRGTLLIHAAARQPDPRHLMDKERGMFMPLGAILGQVKLVDCIQRSELERRARDEGGEWRRLANDPDSGGPVCWLLRKPEWFVDPVPMRGKQGLWWVDVQLIGDPMRIEHERTRQ